MLELILHVDKGTKNKREFMRIVPSGQCTIQPGDVKHDGAKQQVFIWLRAGRICNKASWRERVVSMLLHYQTVGCHLAWEELTRRKH